MRAVPMSLSGIGAWVLAATLSASAEAKPDLDVPADSETHAGLRRLQTRSGEVGAGSMPWRESEAFRFVDSAGTPGDRFRAGVSLTRFRHEILRWEGRERPQSFYLSPLWEAGFSDRAGDSAQQAVLGGLGLKVYGRLFSWLSFYSRGRAFTEYTDRPQFTHQFDPDFGESYSVDLSSGDSLASDRTFNRFEHYLLADFPWVSLKFGRDRVHTGPGYFTSLTASRDTPPYYLAEARVDFAPWLRVSTTLMRMVESDHSIRKYANHHRFEFKPHRSLALGFQDIVIYHDRDPDPAYVLPLTPLAFSEDNNGGRDNDAVALDIFWASPWKISFWGELFVDDLMGPAAFFDDHWENRWAALAGFQVVSPWPQADADLVVEYGRVEPWTYTGRTSQANFKHFNVPSAGKLGPDSRSVDVQAAWRPWTWLELKERLEWNAKGTGRQATLGAIHQDSDGTSKRFLGPGSKSEVGFLHSATLYWRQYARLEIENRHALEGDVPLETRISALLSW